MCLIAVEVGGGAVEAEGSGYSLAMAFRPPEKSRSSPSSRLFGTPPVPAEFSTLEDINAPWEGFCAQQRTENPEVSIEIDPRSCSDEKLRHLRDLGFNRVSYGVQDFDKKTAPIKSNKPSSQDRYLNLILIIYGVHHLI